MTDDTDALVKAASDWWTTEIIDIHPGEIDVRGYPIQDLIGQISFVQMIWLMTRGELPSQDQSELLEAALVASVDHGPHAPSIAIAQMAASCGIGLNNAMASAINVLGDTHGGAGQACMTLYELVRKFQDQGLALAAAVDAALGAYVAENGKIIPGFGHRFHPVDPRAAPLLGLVEAAAAKGAVGGGYVAIGREVEAGIRRRTGKAIPMNIDGATAVIFSELGFAPEMGRGLFILSRSVGILSHAWAVMKTGRRMKGPMPKGIPFTYAGPPRRKFERSE
ncbi:MAG TPA: citryl-CoA lyase [Caulobacteraceae bacterium]|nr:citryl-CoA lyase [Caulobacteraceae bacterium]